MQSTIPPARAGTAYIWLIRGLNYSFKKRHFLTALECNPVSSLLSSLLDFNRALRHSRSILRLAPHKKTHAIPRLTRALHFGSCHFLTAPAPVTPHAHTPTANRCADGLVKASVATATVFHFFVRFGEQYCACPGLSIAAFVVTCPTGRPGRVHFWSSLILVTFIKRQIAFFFRLPFSPASSSSFPRHISSTRRHI